MKSSNQNKGQLGLVFVLSVLVSSCNKSDYFPTEELIAGIDQYCAKAPDQHACESLSACQPAFTMPEDDESGEAEPVYEACVHNPDLFNPPGSEEGSTTGSNGSEEGSTTGSNGSEEGSTTGNDGSEEGSTTGSNGSEEGSTTGSNGSEEGSTTGSNGSEEGSTTGSNGSEEGSTTGSNGSEEGSTTGSNGSEEGSTTGSNGNHSNGNNGQNGNSGNSGSTNGSNGGSTTPSVSSPINDAYQSNCKNVSAEHLFVKQLVKKNQVVGGQSKVKVCHKTGNGSSFTILIACPALKAHVGHHDDTIGTCKQ